MERYPVKAFYEDLQGYILWPVDYADRQRTRFHFPSGLEMEDQALSGFPRLKFQRKPRFLWGLINWDHRSSRVKRSTYAPDVGITDGYSLQYKCPVEVKYIQSGSSEMFFSREQLRYLKRTNGYYFAIKYVGFNRAKREAKYGLFFGRCNDNPHFIRVEERS